MRRLLFLLATALLVLPSVVSAQEQRQGRGRGMMMMNPIDIVLQHAADLDLTDAQTTKLQELNKALLEKNKPTMDEMQKMRESGTMDRESMMAKMQVVRANNAEAQVKLKDILTPAQLEQATKVIEEARPRGRRGGGGQPEPVV